jgi:hypothetical protein
VADVADDGFIFHAHHVLAGNDLVVAGGGDENIGFGQGLFDSSDFKALHCGLQGADGVNFRDQNPRAEAAHTLSAALAHVAVTANHHHFARDHDIRGAL